jgi:hypothetical protein
MLTKVEVRTPRGDLLVLELEDISDGLVIQDIGGLGPVKATLVSSSYASQDGSQYQSSRRDSRNITMQLGLRPDPTTDTTRSLRKRLYNFFTTKTEVSLRFYLEDGLIVDISGRVESCEPAVFVQEPAVDISIMCFDPDFYDPTPTLLTGNTTADSTETIEEYDGEIETGFVFTLNVNRTLSEFTIYHNLPNDTTRTLDFSSPLESGDVLVISTVSGNKGATLVRSGVTSSVLYAISPQSNWIDLEPGDNGLRVYAEGAAIPYTIEYSTKYGGL